MAVGPWDGRRKGWLDTGDIQHGLDYQFDYLHFQMQVRY